MLTLSPSLLSANLGALIQEVSLLQSAGIPWVHWDIMDGTYVPNITMGAGLVTSVREAVPDIFFDVHLMIEKPELHIDSFIKAGANLIVIHTDATRHPQRVLDYIRSCGVLCGISINPHQHEHSIEYLIPYVDIVLVMSVNPGFSGQKFIPETISKIKKINELKEQYNTSLQIQVDGGVCIENISLLYQAGASVFVSGSSFFTGIEKTQDGYKKRYEEFLRAVNK